LRKTISGKEY